jgi:DNA-binding response OmpR family regulator
MANLDSQVQRLGAAKALVVEDEMMLLVLIEDELRELGFHEIIHARSVDDALAAIEQQRPDLAILDVNLDGDRVFPVARRLAEAKVPFFFVTGHQPETIPEEWAETVVLQKPLHPPRLRNAILTAMKLTA